MMKQTKRESLLKNLQLIQELYHINIAIIDTDEAIQSFYEEFHFHKAQSNITRESLCKYTKELSEEILYLTDSFMIHTILFHIDDFPVIMGPFCSVLMSSRDVKSLFDQYNIHDISEQDFYSYYNRFPVISENNAIHIVDTMYHVICGTQTNIKIHKINSRKTTIEDYEDLMQKRENNINLLEQRYANEQKFILDIEKGNAKSAIMDLHNMQADVQYLKNLGTTLESEKVGAAITRTTVRIAAFQAGLPIILIDQISKKNTITASHAKTVNEILAAKETMIREFCTAILDNKKNKYSALVQSIIYYFEHEYYQDISLDELAHDLCISKNHLISTFRSETGLTPVVYLRKLRMEQAAVLLSGTNHSVQEISELIGISDANYFIKLFKNQYGVTPNTYRKKYI